MERKQCEGRREGIVCIDSEADPDIVRKLLGGRGGWGNEG